MGSERSDRRSETDARLLLERRKTDERVAERQRELAEHSDELLKRNRELADAARASSRADEDRQREDLDDPTGVADLLQERRNEDAKLEVHRSAEDAALSAERAHRKELFAALLKDHRVSTDEALRSERADSDQSITSHETFLGIVSHDVRGMVSAISLSSQLILRELTSFPQLDEARRAAVRIQHGADQINALVTDLLDFASIAAGRLAISRERRDLASVVVDALDSIQPLAADKAIRISPVVPREPIIVTIDERRILQVLANLLGNAIKFSPRGSEIRVELKRSGTAVECSVTDFGRGIAKQSLDRVFDRFERGVGRAFVGAGLGLYIARAIVEAHGGRIWVQSQLEKGSTFYFAIPASD